MVAVLEEGHFFGEGRLAGQTQRMRMATATAIAPSTILAVEKPDLLRQLHAQPAFADRFPTHVLTRNIRIEEDLIDHLFNTTGKLDSSVFAVTRSAEADTMIAFLWSIQIPSFCSS